MKYEFDNAVLDVLVTAQKAGKKFYGLEPQGKEIMTILTKAIAMNAVDMDLEFDALLSMLTQNFVTNKNFYNKLLDDARKNDKD